MCMLCGVLLYEVCVYCVVFCYTNYVMWCSVIRDVSMLCGRLLYEVCICYICKSVV